MGSPSAVLADLKTRCKVAGVKAVVQAWPQKNFPWTETPFVVLEVETYNATQITFGGTSTGIREADYQIRVRLMLGSKDMEPKQVQERLVPILAALPAAIGADPTLGGSCFRAETLAGFNNTKANAYQQLRQPPEIDWIVRVLDHGAVGGAI